MPDQRKKTELDELNMRKVLGENDLLVAEVHSINNDRTVNLHTPNVKYGVLEPGLLVEVDHKLVRRQKHHMFKLAGVHVVLGTNGQIFLSNKPREDLSVVKPGQHSQGEVKTISLLNSILKVLDFEGLEMSELLLQEMVAHCQGRGVQACQIMYENALDDYIGEMMRARIPQRINELSKHISFS